jgi:hypothetical protein
MYYLYGLVKKAFIAILAVFYLAVASGVEMNIHYCMGEVASVEYGKAEKGLCGKCGMQSKKGCCEDEAKLIKIQDSHQASQLSWAFELPVAELPSSPVFDRPYVLISNSVIDQPSNGPPPGSHPPIYLTNCVFRI